MNKMKLLILSLLLISISFGQKTRVVGTETKQDLPARSLKEGLDNYKKRNYKAAFSSFVDALKLIDEFQKNPDIFPSDKYQGTNANQYKSLASEYAARSAAKNSDFVEADKYFAKAIEIQPEDPGIWYYYGDYLFDDRRKSTEATNAFFNVIKFAQPNLSSSNSKEVKSAKFAMASANYKLGDIYEKKDQGKALEYYQKSIDINPEYYQPRLKLAKLYEDLKNYKKMEEHFEFLVDQFNSNVSSSVKRRQLANAYLHLGIAQFNNKKYSQAVRSLENVFTSTGVKNLQKNAAYYFLGVSFHKLNNNNKALDALVKVTGSYKASADYEIDIIKNPDKYTN